MIFEPTSVQGALLVRQERNEDERGYFARIWCVDEFARHGIDVSLMQASVSYSRHRGTVRAMHFAWPPSREGKLVRCQRGCVHDAIVDLRPSSPSFLAAHSVELDAQAGDTLYVPPGVAHGFQTLVDDCEIFYAMTDSYRASLADGYRYDDPAFGLRWPLDVSYIAKRDALYRSFDAATHRSRYEQAARART